MAKSLEWKDDSLRLNLKQFDAKANKAIYATMLYHAPRAEAYAKRNAPWTDRTSNARNGLFTRVERGPGVYRLVVAHGVPYGLWLEVRWSGRFQIIRPTVNNEGREIMTTLEGLFQMMFH